MLKKKGFMLIGCLLILGSLALCGLDVYRLINFEKVNATVEVYRRTKGKKARVTYEYGGEIFENKVLASYNGFVMKNGKKLTVMIDPAKPDDPHTTSFALETMCLLCGVAILIGEKKTKGRSETE